jgi:hypothetical protein
MTSIKKRSWGIMFRTNAFDEFEGQRIENHVNWFVGAEYHPQVDDQTQRLGQELGHGVDKTSGTNAAAVAVPHSVTNLIQREECIRVPKQAAPTQILFGLLRFA